MKKSRFNPQEYLASAERKGAAAQEAAEVREKSSRCKREAGGKYEKNGEYAGGFTDLEKARMVAKHVLSTGIDITARREDWLNIGFALAHELGEEGRSVFHDISRPYPGYTPEECDRQYDNCKKQPSAGKSVMLGSFFGIANRLAGVSVDNVMREEREKLNAGSRKWDKRDSGTPCPEINENNIDINNYTDNQEVMKTADSNGTPVTLSHLSYFPDNAENGYIISARVDSGDLPRFLRGIYDEYDDNASRDKLLLATLNVVSGLLGSCNGTGDEPSGIYGLYNRHKVYAPIYNVIYAAAGSGKGEVNVCRQLIRPLQEKMRRQYNAEREAYEKDLEAWEKNRRGQKGSPCANAQRPCEPVFRSPIAAGNNSSSSVYHTMENNGGWALMFETEADTVTQMQRTEYGQYSDLMRKAYHHEALSMNRSTDNLHIYIEQPRLSVLLTCTPGQIAGFLGDFENGLASRFFFYGLPSHEPQFDDVFCSSEKSLDEEFLEMGHALQPLLEALRLRKGNPLQFVMTDSMQKDFVATFREILKDKTLMLGADFSGFIYRLALGCFRYAMVLTALRLMEREENGEIVLQADEKALVCDERDYRTAKTVVTVLLNHSAKVYALLAKESNNPFGATDISLTAEERRIYSMLPDKEFKTADVVEMLGGNKSRKKAGRMLSKFTNKYSLLIPTKYCHYIKAESLEKEKLAENDGSASGNHQNTNPKPLI